MTTILVSGFGSWEGVRENPTIAVLARLRDRNVVPGELRTLDLPVDSVTLAASVERALDDIKPDLWIGLGLAMRSAVVAVERIGVNVLDFPVQDIAGARPSGEPIVAGGPAAYMASLPTQAIVAALRQEGIPARLSNSASTFLCNQLMYTVLHRVAVKGLHTQAGFLHVPAHPALIASQTGLLAEAASMSIDLMVQAVECTVRTTLEPRHWQDGGKPATSG